MTAIRIEDFGGRIPRRSSRLLPTNAAQIATDTKLFSGELRGWNTPLLRKTLDGTGINTVYRIPDDLNDVWIESVYTNVHIQKGSLVNDTHERYYWTSGEDDIPRYNTKDRIESDLAAYILGSPPPDAAPTDNGTPPSGGVSPLTVTRVFVYTFVSMYGEESAPSPPLTLTGAVDDTWTLGAMQIETSPPITGRGNFTNANGATKRIYRTITSVSGQTSFFFIKEVAMSLVSTDVSDIDSDVALNNLLESSGWNEPPDELEGIITHPNGFMVGYVGRDLYFSEPYRPHAWPAKYVLSTDFEIMGLGIVGNTIGVTTQSNPYGCTGIHPEAMSLAKSTTVEPCLSKKGVVTLPTGIMYPSNNGLAWLNPVGATIVTRQFMTKEEWQTEFRPDRINAARYETRYIAFNCTSCGFVYDPIEQKAAVVDLTRVNRVIDIYTDVYTGLVNLLESDRVFEWDPAGNTVPVTYTWKSRVFEFAKPLNMGAAIVKFSDDTFTADAEYIELLVAVNALIAATTPPLGGINSRGMNSRRKIGVDSYTDELKAVFQYQSSSFNGSDMLRIVGFESAIAHTTITVWADGREIYKHSVVKDKMFRLPGGFKAHTYEVAVTSNTDVYSIAMAETPKELKIV